MSWPLVLWNNTAKYLCNMHGKDVEDVTKDIECDSDCTLCLHAQCTCLTENVFKVLASLDSIWERKSCRKTKLPDLNSMKIIMWTLSILILAKHPSQHRSCDDKSIAHSFEKLVAVGNVRQESMWWDWCTRMTEQKQSCLWTWEMPSTRWFTKQL